LSLDVATIHILGTLPLPFRLLGSLVVNCSDEQLLDIVPPTALVDEGIPNAAAHGRSPCCHLLAKCRSTASASLWTLN